MGLHILLAQVVQEVLQYMELVVLVVLLLLDMVLEVEEQLLGVLE
uniref:Uncharacterized protein n=1 Tax=viral metagenome TaxID=1070528 RepID=A0A6M3JVY2_9ZZZZ